MATVSPMLIRPVLSALEKLGVDAERVLRRARLTHAMLQDAQARIPVEAEVLVWQGAVDETGDPCIGLRVAEQIRPGALGSFDYLLRHSETLEQLITRARRYGRLVDDSARLGLKVDGDIACIRLSRVDGFTFHPAGVECLFAITVFTARRAWPGSEPLAVRFAHAGSAGERHRKQLGCPLHFGASSNEIAFEASLLQRSPRRADPNLGKVLEEHTQHLLAQLPRSDDFLELARRALERQLGRGAVQAELLAQALRVSERTLRRKLSAEGTSYQELLDELRRSLALQRVQRPDVSLEELASSLGFADASTFYRAFKRWTGTTPAQYRARLRRAGE